MPLLLQVGLEVALAKRSSRPLVLVTGATGAVGPRVVEAFRAEGYPVRTLSSDPPPAGRWPDDVEARIGDVTDPSAVGAAVQGAGVVVHLAALLHVVNPPPALHARYERVNVEGTSTVLKAAVRTGVGRVVYFSTIAVYGPSAGRILTEATPPQPRTFYARTKLAAEKIVLEARGGDSRPIGTVLRFAAVYGPRIKGNYRRLVQSLARGRFVPVGRGENRRTLVYEGDVARAALLAAEHPAAAGRIFNVTDGRVHTVEAIIGALCAALDRRPPRLRLPLGPIRGLAGILEKGAGICGFRPSVARAMIDTYTEDVAVDGGLFCRQIGFVPRYDLMAGWRETVAQMRLSGDL